MKIVLYAKVLLAAILLIATIQAEGQLASVKADKVDPDSSFYSQVFYFHAQTCHLSGTTEYDYLLQLRPDSSFNYIIYSCSYKTGYRTVVKEQYQGRYSKNTDTIKAEFLLYNLSSKEKGNKSRLFQSGQNSPSTISRIQVFYLKTDSIITNSLSLTPILIKSNPVKLKWLETKFNNRQNKDLDDKEIFGL